MRIAALLMVILTGFLLAYGTIDMPDLADPNSPASSHVSPYYIERSYKDTHTPNMVTAVLADYRGYDTLGETTVIFAAGMACLLILTNVWRKKSND